MVRAEASSADEFSALDMALDKLTLRLRRTRDRRKDHRRGYSDPVPVDLGVVEPTPEVEEPVEVPNNSPAEAVAAELGPGESVEVQVGDTPIVIRRKLHIAEPMTIDEALYEMELIGHDFFLFVNKETGRPSLIAVCPPNAATTPTGFSVAITPSTSSAVSGSKYRRSAVSKSVETVSGLLLIITTS